MKQKCEKILSWCCHTFFLNVFFISVDELIATHHDTVHVIEVPLICIPRIVYPFSITYTQLVYCFNITWWSVEHRPSILGWQRACHLRCSTWSGVACKNITSWILKWQIFSPPPKQKVVWKVPPQSEIIYQTIKKFFDENSARQKWTNLARFCIWAPIYLWREKKTIKGG